jgi:hypothetical protein
MPHFSNILSVKKSKQAAPSRTGQGLTALFALRVTIHAAREHFAASATANTQNIIFACFVIECKPRKLTGWGMLAF